jgi:hypothetical protein
MSQDAPTPPVYEVLTQATPNAAFRSRGTTPDESVALAYFRLLLDGNPRPYAVRVVKGNTVVVEA